MLTPFGWTVAGTLPIEVLGGPHIVAEDCHQTNAEEVPVEAQRRSDELLHEMVEKFWALETEISPKATKTLTEEDARVIEFIQSSMRMKDGKYEVALPFKSDFPLPDNRSDALRNLFANERRGRTDPR